MKRLSVLFLLAAVPARAAVPGAVEGVTRPAYRVVERVTDGVYDALRSYFMGGVLPDRLSRGLEQSPNTDSYDLFANELSRRESRAVARLREAYPVVAAGQSPSTDQMNRWRSQVVQEQMEVVLDSFKDSIIERHRLESFGRYSGQYAKDRRNWSPDFLVPASILGGAFLYVNGMRADLRLKDLRVELSLRSGMLLREALNGAAAPRLAGIELGYRDRPLKVTADWGMARNRRPEERVGLRYSLRY
jgi:hypothetical protein